MIEIGVVAVLFLLSIAANAILTKYSTSMVLGLNISLFRSGVIVAVRSFAALLSGYSVGYAIRLGLAQEQQANTNIQIAGMVLVSLFSFLVYWILLGKLSGSRIPLVGIAKTIAAETLLLLVSSAGVAIVLSILFAFFG